MRGNLAYMVLMSVAYIPIGLSKPDECPALIAGRAWEPLRIKVLTGAMDAINATQSATLMTDILPRAVAFWENAMRIRRTGSPFRNHKRTTRTCGRTVLSKALLSSLDGHTSCAGGCMPFWSPIDEMGGASGGITTPDFVLILTASTPLKAVGHSIGYASPCAKDECGRPTIGFVNLNAKLFEEANNNDTIMSVLIHEMAHTLGFTDGFADWRWPDGSRRIERPKSVRYTVRKDRRGMLDARFGWSWTPFTTLHRYTYPTGIVESIATRGFGAGSTCRCPIDPTKTYTNEDLTDCLRHPGNCAWAVTTPKVKEAARDFFDCETLEGMEFENQKFSSLNEIINTHWKSKLVEGEFMNPQTSPFTLYVSPLTFAFFEDSGWYQMNYSMTSSLVRGATWGYKQGCAFVQQKCISDETGATQRPPMFPNAFCANNNQQCTPDGRGVGQCAVNYPASFTLPQYRYNTTSGLGHRVQDFCPAFIFVYKDWLAHPAGRCLMKAPPSGSLAAADSQFTYAFIRCLGGGEMVKQSYEVNIEATVIGVCTEDGQLLNDHAPGAGKIICSSPAIICAQFRYPHLTASSNANRQVTGVPQPTLPLEGIPFVLNISPIPTKLTNRMKWRPLAPRPPPTLTVV